MENDLLKTSDNFDDLYSEIMVQVAKAMTAIQFQDVNSAEQANITAKLSFKKLQNDVDSEDVNFIKIHVGFIEMITRFLKAILYSNDERYKKSVEELQLAKQICEESNNFINQFYSDEMEEFGALLGFLPMLKFFFAFFGHFINILYDLNNENLERLNGKYIDDIATLRKAAKDIKNFEFGSSNITESPMGNLAIGILHMLERYSDTWERKAERIEQRRKIIEYLQPIGRNIFIVHGHNEGNLRELKEILDKNFKIHPIILRDELDNGKTIIEKIEEYGRLCAFAFILITPDDIVENKKIKSFQARPNVLFELGWFCGRYGRSKVRIIRQKDTALPSDLNGLITFTFNERIEEVFLKIKTDLETMGII